jgi:hypothetical protein
MFDSHQFNSNPLMIYRTGKRLRRMILELKKRDQYVMRYYEKCYEVYFSGSR